MGKTIVEKILSRAGSEDAHAGDIVNTKVSYFMTNDAVGELTIDAFYKLGRKPWDRSRIVDDHRIVKLGDLASESLGRGKAPKLDLRITDNVCVNRQMPLPIL